MATKPIGSLKGDLKKMIFELVTNDMLLDIAEQIRLTIYNRTKSGKGLSQIQDKLGEGNLKPLEELSEGYIRYRQKQILGPYASARRSNLTFSGELLESIVVRIVGKTAVVEIEDVTHSRPGKGGGAGIKMRKLATIMQEGSEKKNIPARPFLGLARVELALIDNYVGRKLRERLRQLQNI